MRICCEAIQVFLGVSRREVEENAAEYVWNGVEASRHVFDVERELAEC